MKRATIFEEKELYWIFYLAGSVSSYIISFGAYYFALKYFAISKISPVMTVGVVLIVVTYGLWAGETITAKQAFGMLLGIISIILILS